MSKKFEKQISEIEFLIIQNDFQKALKDLDKIIKNKSSERTDQIKCLILKSEVMNKLGNHKEAITILDEVLEECKEKEDLLNHIDAIIQKSEAHFRLGQVEQHYFALQIGERLIPSLKFIDNKDIAGRKAVIQYLKMGIPYLKGEYQLAIEYGSKGIQYAKESEDQNTIALLYNALGNSYKMIEEYKKAQKHFDLALQISESTNNKQEIAFSYSGIGFMYFLKKDYKKAIEFKQKALDLNEKIGSIRDIPYIYHDLGLIYKKLFELDLALEYYKKYLEVQGTEIVGLQVIYTSMGNSYFIKGDLENAYDYFLKALKKCEEIGDQRRILPVVLYNLISLLIDKGDKQQAQNYLDQLQLLNSLVDNERVNTMYIFASGKVSKASTRIGDWTRAMALYEELLESKKLPIYWEVVALTNITDILMKELYLTAEKEIFIEVKKRINEIVTIAKENKYHMLLARAYWLQYQLNLAELDVSEAQKNLSKANTISKDKGFSKLANDISQELNKLNNQLSMWEDFAKNKKPLEEALKHLTLENGIKELTKETYLEERDNKTGEIVDYKILFTLKL